MHAGGAFVFLADLLDKAAGHEVLELLIGTEAEHFLATAYRIANLEVRENPLEQVVEAKYLLFGKDSAKLIGHMIWKAAGESGAFRGNCHNEMTIHSPKIKAN